MRQSTVDVQRNNRINDEDQQLFLPKEITRNKLKEESWQSYKTFTICIQLPKNQKVYKSVASRVYLREIKQTYRLLPGPKAKEVHKTARRGRVVHTECMCVFSNHIAAAWGERREECQSNQQHEETNHTARLPREGEQTAENQTRTGRGRNDNKHCISCGAVLFCQCFQFDVTVSSTVTHLCSRGGNKRTLWSLFKVALSINKVIGVLVSIQNSSCPTFLLLSFPEHWLANVAQQQIYGASCFVSAKGLVTTQLFS